MSHLLMLEITGSFVFALTLWLMFTSCESQINIVRVAGTGVAGTTGSGGPATSATFNGPRIIWPDSTGTFYITEQDGQVVRKFSNSNNILLNFAGLINSASFSGDGGQATSAQLYAPTDVKVDTAGRAYIADLNNNRIRRVSNDGIISTVVGEFIFLWVHAT